MHARGTFVLAGLLAVCGVALMGWTFMQSASLPGEREWSRDVKGLRSILEDDHYPAPQYIEAERQYEKQLQADNEAMQKRLRGLADALNRYFPEARGGPAQPAIWNQRFGEAVQELRTTHDAITRDLNWGNENLCPVVWTAEVPDRETIPILQKKYWIFQAILEALATHQPTTRLDDNQLTSISECLISRGYEQAGPRRRRGGGGGAAPELEASDAYETYRVELRGLIPYAVLTAAIDDLGTAPLTGGGVEGATDLLFVLTDLEVQRVHADPTEPDVIEYPYGEDPPEVRTAPGLQCKVMVGWEVRLPLPLPRPEEER